jgi:UDP-N-acetylmuramate--alanine ligase
MSGIATVMVQRGNIVSGSDPSVSSRTKKLAELGATISNQHHADNLPDDTDYVIYSTAINQDNVELKKAERLGIPVLHRSEMLAKVVSAGKGIAIAGAHGKTTTTSMLAHVMLGMQLDPTVVIGGEIDELKGNATHGQGEYVVVEADESDGSLVNLRPFGVIVTNIDEDHLDYFGSLQNIIDTFASFVNWVPDNGVAVFCGDDANNRTVINSVKKNVVTYGENPNNDYILKDYIPVGCGSAFAVWKSGEPLINCELTVPGIHNALNAVGVISLLCELGIDIKIAVKVLATFNGAKRRFHKVGYYCGAELIDDYAHHPKEIKMTLQAARNYSQGRIIAVFQPHRYSRTQFLFRDFADSFSLADEVIITDIYSAGEAPIAGVSGQMILDAMDAVQRGKSSYAENFDAAVAKIKKSACDGDLVVTMGAGDVWNICQLLSAQQA